MVYRRGAGVEVGKEKSKCGGSEMNSAQEEVYRAVEDRGYLNPEKWSNDQLIIRQIVKLIEELGELSWNTRVRVSDRATYVLMRAENLGKFAKEVFDSGQFIEPMYDKTMLKRELADIQVVVFVLATLLGIDSEEEAWHKATKDVPRGIG
jgi:NTP pyrophosphatase (non-canonical NTP hydrolase)